MFCFFGPEACGILAPWPGIKLSPLALEGEVLTTGPPGKSLGHSVRNAASRMVLRPGWTSTSHGELWKCQFPFSDWRGTWQSSFLNTPWTLLGPACGLGRGGRAGAAPFGSHPIHLDVSREGEPLPVRQNSLSSAWLPTLVRAAWGLILPGITPIFLLKQCEKALPVLSPREAAGLRRIIN